MTRREQREAVLSLLYEYTFYESTVAADFLAEKRGVFQQ